MMRYQTSMLLLLPDVTQRRFVKGEINELHVW